MAVKHQFYCIVYGIIRLKSIRCANRIDGELIGGVGHERQGVCSREIITLSILHSLTCECVSEPDECIHLNTIVINFTIVFR